MPTLLLQIWHIFDAEQHEKYGRLEKSSLEEQPHAVENVLQNLSNPDK